jgi:hypothetical protein
MEMAFLRSVEHRASVNAPPTRRSPRAGRQLDDRPSSRFWRAVALDRLIGGPSAKFVTDSCPYPGANAAERAFRLN